MRLGYGRYYNMLRSEQNGRHCADGISKCDFGIVYWSNQNWRLFTGFQLIKNSIASCNGLAPDKLWLMMIDNHLWQWCSQLTEILLVSHSDVEFKMWVHFRRGFETKQVKFISKLTIQVSRLPTSSDVHILPSLAYCHPCFGHPSFNKYHTSLLKSLPIRLSI